VIFDVLECLCVFVRAFFSELEEFFWWWWWCLCGVRDVWCVFVGGCVKVRCAMARQEWRCARFWCFFDEAYASQGAGAIGVYGSEIGVYGLE
jgi:hypothetical protein